jgi:hypothetical protein
MNKTGSIIAKNRDNSRLKQRLTERVTPPTDTGWIPTHSAHHSTTGND